MIKGNLAKNTTYFTGALVFQKILSFIYFWFVSNSLLPGQLGQYIFALSFTTLFSIFVDLGLSPVLTREAAKDKSRANSLLQNVIALKLILSLLTALAAWAAIILTGKPPEVRLLVYLASFIMLMDSFSLSFWVIFRSQHTLKYESVGTILVQIIIFVLGIIALKTTGQVRYLMLGLVVASLFNLLFSASLLKIKLKFSLRPKWNKEIVRYLIKLVPAFALSGIFIKIYNTSDSVLLSYLASDAAVGFYAIPAKVVYALQQIIPAAFSAVIFPAFSFYYINSKELLLNTFNKSINYLTIVSIPVSAGLVILTPQIINKFWPTYATVIPTFIIMALAIPFIFLAFPTGYLLNACNRQKNNTINRGIITALAVFLNVILIPAYGFFGSGIAFLVTNLILIILDFIWVVKILPLQARVLSKIIFKPIFATIVMAVLVLAVKNQLSIFLTVFTGGITYFLILYLIKGFDLSDLKLLAKNPS